MNNSQSYILGFTTLSLAYFLGYLWSPDYLELVSNGYIHLLITFFGVGVFIGTSLVDLYFDKKKEARG